MPTSFCPRLETLDARDLPSVTPFTFTLSNGTPVSETFAYADTSVDTSLVSQQIPVSDLTVTLNGQTATLPIQLSAPAAAFALGQFQGLVLSGVAIANGTVEIIDTTGVLNPVSVPVLPDNPITPVPGVGPTDWAVAVES